MQAPLLHQRNSLSGSHPEAQGPSRLPSVLASFFPQKNDGEGNLRRFCFCSSHNRRWLCWQRLREGSGVFRHAPVLPPISCKREVYCSSHWSHLPQMSSDLLRSPEVCNLLICLVSSNLFSIFQTKSLSVLHTYQNWAFHWKASRHCHQQHWLSLLRAVLICLGWGSQPFVLYLQTATDLILQIVTVYNFTNCN